MAAEDIRLNSLKPKKATVDDVSAEQHSINDQIKADIYARNLGAVQGRRLNFAKIRPPGST